MKESADISWWSFGGDALFAVLVGWITAVTVFPLLVFALFFFIVSAYSVGRARIEDGHGRRAIVGAIVAVAFFCSVVGAAAAYQPTKAGRQRLAQPLTLPAAKMTLAELAYLASYERDVFPILAHFSFRDADQRVAVDFRKRTMTLGEFFDAMDEQTELQYRINYCANGYTVLWGNSCCFGVFFSDSGGDRSDVEHPRFDVHAYAAERDRA